MQILIGSLVGAPFESRLRPFGRDTETDLYQLLCPRSIEYRNGLFPLKMALLFVFVQYELLFVFIIFTCKVAKDISLSN